MRVVGAVLVMIGGITLGMAAAAPYGPDTVARFVVGVVAVAAGAFVVMVAK